MGLFLTILSQAGQIYLHTLTWAERHQAADHLPESERGAMDHNQKRDHLLGLAALCFDANKHLVVFFFWRYSKTGP